MTWSWPPCSVVPSPLQPAAAHACELPRHAAATICAWLGSSPSRYCVVPGAQGLVGARAVIPAGSGPEDVDGLGLAVPLADELDGVPVCEVPLAARPGNRWRVAGRM